MADMAPAAADEKKLPPVTQIGMLSLALIIAGAVYLVSYLPRAVPLGPAILLLAMSLLLLAANLFALSRVRSFNWMRFFQVGKWALLAYAITAGLIEFVFLRNGLTGAVLVVLTLSIVVYTVHVPALIAFTVARYDHDE